MNFVPNNSAFTAWRTARNARVFHFLMVGLFIPMADRSRFGCYITADFLSRTID